jgi:hypothetical protein
MVKQKKILRPLSPNGEEHDKTRLPCLIKISRLSANYVTNVGLFPR